MGKLLNKLYASYKERYIYTNECLFEYGFGRVHLDTLRYDFNIRLGTELTYEQLKSKWVILPKEIKRLKNKSNYYFYLYKGKIFLREIYTSSVFFVLPKRSIYNRIFLKVNKNLMFDKGNLIRVKLGNNTHLYVSCVGVCSSLKYDLNVIGINLVTRGLRLNDTLYFENKNNRIVVFDLKSNNFSIHDSLEVIDELKLNIHKLTIPTLEDYIEVNNYFINSQKKRNEYDDIECRTKIEISKYI